MAMFFDSNVSKLLQAGYDKGNIYNHEGISFILTLKHIDPFRNDLNGFKWKIEVFNQTFYLPIRKNITYPCRAQWIYEKLEKINPNNEKNVSLAWFIDKKTTEIIENLNII